MQLKPRITKILDLIMRSLKWVIVTIAGIVVLYLLSILVIHTPTWPTWTGFNGKTAWDLAELLIVPFVLAVGAFLFNRAERQNEQKIAQDRVEETTLQNYLDKMTELLLEPNNLRNSSEDAEVRSIARARTLTVLRGLNAERKGSVIQFLHESRLIKAEQAIIDLTRADLQGAYLERADLQRTDLGGANLEGANLRGADLLEVELSETNLIGADLQGAYLERANLWGAKLKRANLSGAKLKGVNLSVANLQEADLARANLSMTDLRGANLLGADLREANLSGADLQGVNLEGANLIKVIYNSYTHWPQGFPLAGKTAQDIVSNERDQLSTNLNSTQEDIPSLSDSSKADALEPVRQAEEGGADRQPFS